MSSFQSPKYSSMADNNNNQEEYSTDVLDLNEQMTGTDIADVHKMESYNFEPHWWKTSAEDSCSGQRRSPGADNNFNPFVNAGIDENIALDMTAAYGENALLDKHATPSSLEVNLTQERVSESGSRQQRLLSPMVPIIPVIERDVNMLESPLYILDDSKQKLNDTNEPQQDVANHGEEIFNDKKPCSLKESGYEGGSRFRSFNTERKALQPIENTGISFKSAQTTSGVSGDQNFVSSESCNWEQIQNFLDQCEATCLDRGIPPPAKELNETFVENHSVGKYSSPFPMLDREASFSPCAGNIFSSIAEDPLSVQAEKDVVTIMNQEPFLSSTPAKHFHLSSSQEDGKIVKCPDCIGTFRSTENLRRHVRIHDSPAPWFCLYCNGKFKDKSSCFNHMEKLHTKRSAEVNQTGLTSAKSQIGHDAHENVYPDRKRYTCGLCGKELKAKNSFERHLHIVHLRITPFNCNYCPQRFSNKNNMDVHAFKMHGEHGKAVAVGVRERKKRPR